MNKKGRNDVELNKMKDPVQMLKRLFRPRYTLDHAIQVVQEYFPKFTKAEAMASLSLPVEEEMKNGVYTSTKVLNVALLKEKDPKVLLQAHGYNPGEWELLSSKSKMWNAYSKLDKRIDMFSSTITVKPKQSLTPEMIMETYKSLQSEIRYPLPKYKPLKNPKMLELAIFDAHIGKLCWRLETSDDYDSKIAIQMYEFVVSEILNRITHLSFDKILIPIGNDFLNADNQAGQTTKGTPQTMDSRIPKMYYKGCELLVNTINSFRSIAPVEVVYIPGNHDHLLSYCLTMHLWAWFKENKEVQIDISPKARKYIQYGKCMIGYSHGEEKSKNINYLMQAEAPQMWGATKYREFHLGHKHVEIVDPIPGMKSRRIPSFTGNDGWHYLEGYVEQVKESQAFVWDKERGLEDILNITVDNEILNNIIK